MKVKQLIKKLLTADQEAEVYFHLIDKRASINGILKLQIGDDNDPEKEKVVILSCKSIHDFVKAGGYID